MFLHLLKSLLAGAVLALAAQSVYALQVGDKAPDFSLPSTMGGNIKLGDFAGKKLLVVFFYNGAFNRGWTQEALGFQLDLPKFEAANAQVLGVSVDFLSANQAWAEKLGVTYPLLSDARREMSRAYESLYDTPAKIGTLDATTYFRSKRSWFVIDKQGIMRYMRVEPNNFVLPTDELLEVVNKYQ